MAGLIVALIVSALICGAAARIPGHSPLAGPSDKPPKAHSHRELPSPLGGVGVFAGVNLALLVEGRFDPGILIASVLLLAVGMIDDFLGLPPLLRLLSHGAAGVVLVAWGDLPLLSGPVHAVVGVGVVVVLVNAVNLFDGLDGLAGLAAVISVLGVVAVAAIRDGSPTSGLALAGALAGFLLYNWHPARIFLGDSGAYLTGLLLAYSIFQASPAGSGLEIVLASGVVGVFLVDLVATVFRRWRHERPLFEGDRSHIYDRLRDKGWAVKTVAVASGAVQLGFVVLTVGLEGAALGWWAVAIVVGTGGALLASLGGRGYL